MERTKPSEPVSAELLHASLVGRSRVDGSWTSDESARFWARNPADGTALDPEFVSASSTDVARAAQLASSAFETWGAFEPRARAHALNSVADALAEAREALVARALLETALTRPRLEAEHTRTVNQWRAFAKLVDEGSWVEAVLDHGDPARTPMPKPDVRRMLFALGPVAVFGASNFPLAFGTPGGDTAAALAAGCTVIVKGHPLHPGTGEIAALAIERGLKAAGAAQGTFAFLQAGGERANAIGLELVAHPAVRAGAFTGSEAAGVALARVAAARQDPIPFFAEMGSVNPIFVLPGALPARRGAFVAALQGSVSGSAGQLCTRPGLVFLVGTAECEALALELTRAWSALGPQAMLSRAHLETWRATLDRLLGSSGVSEVVTAPAVPQSQALVAPRVLVTSAATLKTVPELGFECFGPSVVLVACTSEAELLDAARALRGSLTATVWAGPGDREIAIQLWPILVQRAGRVLHEGMPTGVEVCEAMVHSGPFPACTRPDSSSVGALALRRFTRPVAFQNVPDAWLPPALRDANPLRIARRVDGISWAAPSRA